MFLNIALDNLISLYSVHYLYNYIKVHPNDHNGTSFLNEENP